jgi:hypothetical protein
MNPFTVREIDTWENEGGAVSVTVETAVPRMSGTELQVEWAERIKRQVNADFDRVAVSFRSIAAKQGADERAGTEAVIAILEDKRSQVLAKEEAGYFIRVWQEITDQVRQMIFRDPRYKAIKSNKAARLHPTDQP